MFGRAARTFLGGFCRHRCRPFIRSVSDAEPATITNTDRWRLTSGTMQAWRLRRYGGTDQLQLDAGVLIPAIRSSSHVLVEVRAASVNPLDVVRTDGYGRKVLGTLKCLDDLACSEEFPQILGRDFSGIVRDKSADVREFKPDDEVMGWVHVQRQGSHAEYVVVPTSCVVKKPKHLSHIEAASVPYAALTVWSSLVYFGRVRQRNAKGRKALILGGAGGLGTFAIQLLKVWGMNVTTVVRTDAKDLVANLGADHVVDYTEPSWEESLRLYQPFDVILNFTTNLSSTFAMDCLKVWGNASYICTTSPLLRNIDAHGWPLGLLNSAAEFGFDAFLGLRRGQLYSWGYVLPSKTALVEIANLVESNQVKPVIEAVFPFEETREAYQKVRSGHARGKTVIDLSDTNCT